MVERDVTRRAVDAVEWLAGLWGLADSSESHSANPHLLALVREAPAVSRHPIVKKVAAARQSDSRDAVIKAIVSGFYGAAGERQELCAALEQFGDAAEGLLGSDRHGTLQQARREAAHLVDLFAGAWDPAGDLATLVGERVPLRVVLAPSVLLPAPNAGRHGVLVDRFDGSSVAHLHFGLALRRERGQFMVNRPWLLGGAWHYAIQLYLRRHWPTIARRLAELPETRDAVQAVLASSRPQTTPGRREDRRSWTDILSHHLNVAIKCVLSHRLGLPDAFHRLAGRAEGCVLAPWFEQWLEAGLGEAGDFAARLRRLPEALAREQSAWERLAAEAALPLTGNVNFTLCSPSITRAVVVVPDEWTADEAAAIGEWAPPARPVQRYGEWSRSQGSAPSPVIAIGEPDRNPLVKRVLEQRGLNLMGFNLAVPAIVAVSLPGFTEAEWCVAVAVTRPESAAELPIETVLRQTKPCVVFDGGVVVDRV
jgi:hypothetical protein